MNKMFGSNLLVSSDGTQVEYMHTFGRGRRWTITASKLGVSMSDSPVLTTHDELDQFAQTLSMAFRDFMSLNRTGQPFKHAEPEAPNAEPTA